MPRSLGPAIPAGDLVAARRPSPPAGRSPSAFGDGPRMVPAPRVETPGGSRGGAVILRAGPADRAAPVLRRRALRSWPSEEAGAGAGAPAACVSLSGHGSAAGPAAGGSRARPTLATATRRDEGERGRPAGADAGRR